MQPSRSRTVPIIPVVLTVIALCFVAAVAALSYSLLRARQGGIALEQTMPVVAPVPAALTPELEHMLADAACGKPVTPAQDGLHCPVCPSDSADGLSSSTSAGWTLDSALLGHFTSAAADEAVLRIAGCEPHADDFGGDFLLRRQGSAWALVRYVSGGMAEAACQPLAWLAGRTALVCQHGDMHQGVQENSVFLVTFEPVAPAANDGAPPFLFVTDDTSNCPASDAANTFQQAQITSVHLLPPPVAGTSQDVEIIASIGRLKVPPGQGDCPKIPAQPYRLLFRSAGDHYTVVAGADSLKPLRSESNDEDEVSLAAIVKPYQY